MLTIFHLTLVEARRRKILVAAVLCGLGFLAVFGTGIFLAAREMVRSGQSFIERQLTLAILTVAGCYAANFLVALFAILLPIDALSGEIDSGVMETIASKPIRRADIFFGKWLAYGVVVAAYAVALVGGVFLISRLAAGFVPNDAALVLLLEFVEIAVLLTVALVGGTRFRTVTNAILALGFYGIAFIGGWVEQIGTFAGLRSARNLGIVVSLISPVDALWRLGSYYIQPSLIRDSQQSPFMNASVPSALMVAWAIVMTAATLAWGVHQFSRRAL